MKKIIWAIANFIGYGEFCAVFIVMCFIQPANLIGAVAIAALWVLFIFALSVFTIDMQKARKKFC